MLRVVDVKFLARWEAISSRLMRVISSLELLVLLDDLNSEKGRLSLLDELGAQRDSLFVAVQCLVVLA